MIIEGYKSTEIGTIPEAWNVKTLGDLYDITSSKRVFQEDWRDNGVPFYRTRELVILSEKGKIDNELFISEEMYREYTSKTGEVQPDDILVSGVGTLGITYVVKPGDRFYFKDGNIIWLKNKGVCCSQFINYQFQSPHVTSQILGNSTGTTVGTYTIVNAKATMVAIPPLAEQRKIADILSTVDEHIAETESLIDKTKVLKQGLMQRLLTQGIGHTEFTDTEIGRIPKEWNVSQLIDVVVKKTPNSFIDGDWIESEYICDNGIRIIQTGNIGLGYFVEKESKKYISEDSFSLLNCKDVKAGDILICRMAEPTGRSCIVPDIGSRMVTAVDCVIMRVDPNIANKEFVNSYLNTSMHLDRCKQYEAGTTRRRISRKNLEHLPIPVPPILEQRQIASILKIVNDQIDAYQTKLNTLTRLKSGLMQQLLTGRIRVKI